MAQLDVVPVVLGFVWTSTSIARRGTTGDGAQIKCVWQLETEHSQMSKLLTEVSFTMRCKSDPAPLTKTKTSGTSRQAGKEGCAVRSNIDSDVSRGSRAEYFDIYF